MNHEIRDVEIFATGTHNGELYTDEDLNEMVRNANQVGFESPLKDGHNEDKGAPALGWVRNLRKIGKKLVCDFVDVPNIVYEAIKNRRYNHISSEIYWNLKNSKGTFRRVLKAVALLGAEMPAVADLKPLRETVFSRAEYKRHEYMLYYAGSEDEKDRAVRINNAIDEQIRSEYMAQLEVDSRVRKFINEHPQFDYSQAMKMVLNADLELKRKYAGVPAAKEETSRANIPVQKWSPEAEVKKKIRDLDVELAKAAQEKHEAGIKLDKLTKKYLTEHPSVSYIEAFHIVLNDTANLDLKQAYGR